MPQIAQQSYGKSEVRVTKVTREGDIHSIIEMEVNIQLDGDFDAAYTQADNTGVIPTDTMKNTVYTLARKHYVPDIETFASLLARHFVDNFAHVSLANVSIEQHLWRRFVTDGCEHAHAFYGSNSERNTCAVAAHNDELVVVSGLDDLTVLKTTRSGFSDFLHDQYTTLQDTDDRIFATTISAEWEYRQASPDWNACRDQIRESLLNVFANHDSKSVQHTLHDMGEAALDACDAIESITLSMPNEHRLLANLEPFGLDNPNEIFVPTEQPYGDISATVVRDAT